MAAGRAGPWLKVPAPHQSGSPSPDTAQPSGQVTPPPTLRPSGSSLFKLSSSLPVLLHLFPVRTWKLSEAVGDGVGRKWLSPGTSTVWPSIPQRGLAWFFSLLARPGQGGPGVVAAGWGG